MRLLLNPTVMSFDFIVPEMKPSESIQKIAGFSRGHHHKNSIRLGIRKENDYCVLYFYAYIKGQRTIQRIGKYEIGELVKCELNWGSYIECKANDGYAFRIAPRHSFPIGYQLFPYAEKDGVRGVEVPIDIDIMDLIIN